MKVSIKRMADGAKEAEGLTVIIDVFRAFTTAAYLYSQGAKCIYPIGDLDDAYKTKERIENAFLVGERDGIPPEGFDMGNSPSISMKADVKGKNVIHTTSSGTQGIVLARGASEIITGSFVNAHAIVRYIKEKMPEELTLVAMGVALKEPAVEDELCAEYLEGLLMGDDLDFDLIKNEVERAEELQKFFDESKPWYPKEDFPLCLNLSVFDFVLRAERNVEGDIYLKRIDV